MQDHLHGDALWRLVHRRCHASRAYGWLLHLLACTHCRQRTVEDHPEDGERFLREIFRTQEPLQPPDLEDPERLDRILEDLQTRGLAEYLREGDIPPLLADLQRHPPQRQRLILDNTERLWTLSTAMHLLERSEAEIFHIPKRGLHLASLALSVLARLSPSHYHPRLLADYRGRALASRANFHRILNRRLEAKRDFGCAERCLDEGSGDPEDRALLLQRKAILERSRLGSEESLRLLRKSGALFHRVGDRKNLVELRITLAQTLMESGRSSEAHSLYRALLEDVDADRDGTVSAWIVRNNFAHFLARQGLGTEAYRTHRETHRRLPSQQPRIALKSQITWAWIFEALGDYRAADDVVREVEHRLGPYHTTWDLGANRGLQTRLALQRKDRLLAQRYAREACQLLARARDLKAMEAVQRMLAGGPLVAL